MKMISVRLDDEEAAVLDALCEAQGMSCSRIITRAVRDLAHARRRAPFGRVARERGIVASFSGARDPGERYGSPSCSRSRRTTSGSSGGRMRSPSRSIWRRSASTASRPLGSRTDSRGVLPPRAGIFSSTQRS